jgi:uncharacterized RDD family membrane protein YckC
MAQERAEHFGADAPPNAATPARRLAGWVVDLAFLSFLVLPVDAYFLKQGTSSGLVAVLMLVVGVLYWVVPTASIGRTLGKLVVRTRVLPLSPARSQVGLGPAFVRWLALAGPLLLFPGLPPALGLAALVWLGVVTWPVWHDPTRRGWHDRAAGTLVVHEPRRSRADPLSL